MTIYSQLVLGLFRLELFEFRGRQDSPSQTGAMNSVVSHGKYRCLNVISSHDYLRIIMLRDALRLNQFDWYSNYHKYFISQLID